MATGFRGARATPDDATVQRRHVADELVNVSPKLVPLLKRIGIDGESGTNPKREWQEDELFAMSSTVSSTTTVSDTETTALVFSGDHSFNFSIGDILRIGTEDVRVTAVGADDSVTMSRGHGGTTAAAHAAAAVITKVGTSLLENTDTPAVGGTVHSFPYNYYQIFDKYIQVSHREMHTSEYNVEDRLDSEMAKLLKHLMLLLERAVFYGNRVAETSTVASTMGGLETFITDNTDTTAEAITEKKINDLLALCFDDVGHENLPTLAVCNQWQKRKVSDMFRPMARMDRATRTGGVVVDVIDTDLGEIDVLLDHNCPTDRFYLLNPSFVSVAPYEGSAFWTADLALSGAYVKREVYGDYTLEVRADKAHGYMSGLTTS